MDKGKGKITDREEEELKVQEELEQLAFNAFRFGTDDQVNEDIDLEDPEGEVPLPPEIETIDTDDEEVCQEGVPSRNKDGFIRVVKRVAPLSKLALTWIPKDVLQTRINQTVRQEVVHDSKTIDLGPLDKRFRSGAPTFEQYISNSCDSVLCSFEDANDKDNEFKRFDDWTGLQLCHGSGPSSMSLDACQNIASLAIDGEPGQLTNHALNNLFMTTEAINKAKWYQAPVVMAIIGTWLRTIDESRDFAEKAPELRFLFNCFLNCSMLHIVTGISQQSRKSRFEFFNSIIKDDAEIFHAFLEATRTGRFSSFLKQLYKKQKLTKFHLFRLGRGSDGYERLHPKNRKIDSASHKKIYEVLIRIAKYHSIDKQEFEQLFTIKSYKMPGKRVFFPYYIWTGELAEHLQWDVDTTSRFFDNRFKILQKCDRKARDLNVNEPHLSADRLMYHVAHLLCAKARKLKKAGFSGEELKCRVGLDRAGLPILPFACCPVKATLAKYPQHGIAMETGYRGAADNADFDPVKSWVKAYSTIEYTTVAMNNAQGVYDADVLGDIVASLQCIPSDGLLAGIHKSMGLEVWEVPLSNNNAVRCPKPTFSFDILLSNKPWIEGGTHDFKCRGCDEGPFTSSGALLRHLYDNHMSPDVEKFQCKICRSIFPSQAAHTWHETTHPEDSQAHYTKCVQKWDSYLRCPFKNCIRQKAGHRFANAWTLNTHIQVVHWQVTPCVCPDCNKAFRGETDLTRHIDAVHKELQPFNCTQCGQFFSRLDNARRHKGKKHTHSCTSLGCLMRFIRKSDLDAHYLFRHPNSQEAQDIKKRKPSDQPQRCALCSIICSNLTALRQHIYTQHIQAKEDRPKFSCLYAGCSKEYFGISDLTKHLRKDHRDYWCNNCHILFLGTNDGKEACQTHNNKFHILNRECGVVGARWREKCHKPATKKNHSICIFCGKTEHSATFRTRHLNIEHPLCDVVGCEVRVKTPADLPIHRKTHKCCPHCPQDNNLVADKYVLQVHEDRPDLHCPACQEWHWAPAVLEQHIRDKHTDSKEDGNGDSDGDSDDDDSSNRNAPGDKHNNDDSSEEGVCVFQPSHPSATQEPPSTPPPRHQIKKQRGEGGKSRPAKYSGSPTRPHVPPASWPFKSQAVAPEVIAEPVSAPVPPESPKRKGTLIKLWKDTASKNSILPLTHPPELQPHSTGSPEEPTNIRTQAGKANKKIKGSVSAHHTSVLPQMLARASTLSVAGPSQELEPRSPGSPGSEGRHGLRKGIIKAYDDTVGKVKRTYKKRMPFLPGQKKIGDFFKKDDPTL